MLIRAAGCAVDVTPEWLAWAEEHLDGSSVPFLVAYIKRQERVISGLRARARASRRYAQDSAKRVLELKVQLEGVGVQIG